MAQTSSDAEEWRDIPGYEGLYMVSNYGAVRSLDRDITHRNRWRMCTMRMRGRVLRQYMRHDGYLYVNLTRKAVLSVHALVAAAFIGERPHGMFVCHNDGNPSNNYIDNIRYCTPRENRMDCIKHGTHNLGSKSEKAKLTREQVLEVRKRLLLGERQTDIAKRFGISQSVVSRMRSGGSTYRHVQ
jgi:hypothetical protein